MAATPRAIRVVNRSELGDVIDSAYQELVQYTTRLRITLGNVMQVLAKAMEIAETMADVDRKSWVLAAVTRVIEINPLLNDADKNALVNFVRLQGAAFIDLVVSATKGALRINQVLQETSEDVREAASVSCADCFRQRKK